MLVASKNRTLWSAVLLSSAFLITGMTPAAAGDVGDINAFGGQGIGGAGGTGNGGSGGTSNVSGNTTSGDAAGSNGDFSGNSIGSGNQGNIALGGNGGSGTGGAGGFGIGGNGGIAAGDDVEKSSVSNTIGDIRGNTTTTHASNTGTKPGGTNHPQWPSVNIGNFGDFSDLTDNDLQKVRRGCREILEGNYSEDLQAVCLALE